jgi:hypothetical protein
MIRKLLIPLATLAICLGAAAMTAPLGGCATTPLVPPSIGLVVLQGDTTIDSLYNKSAKAYLAAASTLDPVKKAQAKAIFAKLLTCDADGKCTGIVQAADTAEQLGNATNAATQVAAFMDLYGQLKPLLGMK